MQVPLLTKDDSEHQAPLAELAEWLSQNLQEDVQGDAMVSSPTHPSRWGPLAPAGIVESEYGLLAPCAAESLRSSASTYCTLLDCTTRANCFQVALQASNLVH